MRLLVRWIINTLALWVVVSIVPGFSYRSWVTLVIAGAVLGIVNTLVRPVLYVLTLPLTILTLGLFLLVLNAIMLKLTVVLVPGLEFQGCGWPIFAAAFLTAVTMIADPFMRKSDER